MEWIARCELSAAPSTNSGALCHAAVRVRLQRSKPSDLTLLVHVENIDEVDHGFYSSRVRASEVVRRSSEVLCLTTLSTGHVLSQHTAKKTTKSGDHNHL